MDIACSFSVQPSLRIQLWSYNYDPEPTGIGPVSRAWAQSMRERGHTVRVIAAHPHYPEPRWGRRFLPYRETRDGILVLRLPLWVGRSTARERYRQDLSFMLAQSAALPILGRADVVVSVSPSFSALLPAIASVRARRTPWIIWLQDLLPDGAAATGLVAEGSVMHLARRLERAAYRTATRIVVPSRSFATNLITKGVPEDKIQVIYNPATRTPRVNSRFTGTRGNLRILSMGNIGHSQMLASLVKAFEEDGTGASLSAKLIIAGTGVAATTVRAELRSGWVEMPGLVGDARLEQELASATLALVSQRHNGVEFNVPSKVMNFMTYGLPVIAAVNPNSEVARIVCESQAGWVVDSADPRLFPAKLREIASSHDEIAKRGEAARTYAQQHFSARNMAQRFDLTLNEVLPRPVAGSCAVVDPGRDP